MWSIITNSVQWWKSSRIVAAYLWRYISSACQLPLAWCTWRPYYKESVYTRLTKSPQCLGCGSNEWTLSEVGMHSEIKPLHKMLIVKIQMCIAFTSSSSCSATVITAEEAIKVDNEPLAFRNSFCLWSYQLFQWYICKQRLHCTPCFFIIHVEKFSYKKTSRFRVHKNFLTMKCLQTTVYQLQVPIPTV